MRQRVVIHSSVLGMLLLGVFRQSPSVCALSFGVPRLIISTSCRHRASLRRSIDSAAVSSRIATLVGRTSELCVWAKATKAAPEVDTFNTSIDEFEDELESMISGNEVGHADRNVLISEAAEPQTATKLSFGFLTPLPNPRASLLQSNIQILERDCGVDQLMINTVRAREGWLYLGLDISTSSTGYAVLTPSTPALDPSDTQRETLIKTGKARLVEWGCIPGVDNGGRKQDVVDVGIVVEEALREVAERCRGASSGDDGSSVNGNGNCREKAPSGGAGRLGLGLSEVSAEGTIWVVGVEDFMRRFLPGKSNAKSMFALAQLNGIVKYACKKHLGASAGSFHPSTPRSFYGLLQDRPEGKGMKEIVHDFVLSQEGGLHSRYEWALSADGTKADSSYDITDAYLVALYAWHRDVYQSLADDDHAKARFVESFQALHAEKLLAAEERSLKMLMDGDMPPARGKKKLKPMTERSARNAHRKLEDVRLTKVFETALMHWFRRRLLGTDL